MSGKNAIPTSGVQSAHTAQEPDAPKFCAIDDPTCESCQ
jgi:hypothetical protein